MRVDAATYVDGERRACGDLSDELAARRAAGEGFVWIGLADPDPAELEDVASELGLHPLALEDAVRGRQRAKVEQYDGVLFVVLKTLSYVEDGSQVETGEIMVFVGDCYAVTLRRGPLHPLAEVRSRLEASGERLRHGPVAVLHAVMDAVVDGYLAVDGELGRDVDELEERVFAGGRGDESPALYLLKREVLEARRAAVPLLEPVRALASGHHPLVHPDERPYFRDVADHLARVVDHVQGYDQLLGDALDANLARVTMGQNDDMRRMSAYAAIFAALTTIAGVYGMNFERMPELEWALGYPFALGLMVVTAVVLYRRFKRAGWL